MTSARPESVAVVGIGCRFPGGGNSPETFWKLLCDGVDAITEVPAERFDSAALFDPDPGRPGKLYSRWGGFVDGVDEFDAGFFGISPREAARIDPQQRMLLEVVWEAFEDGGLSSDRIIGSGAGVFVGISTHDYYDMQVGPAYRHLIDAHSSTGSATSVAANRISYVYDLRGPSLAVDTACSSSLTAVHLACQSLKNRECDLAIAGGVNLYLMPETAIGFCRASMLSPHGRCKAFDAEADGFVRSEGAGIVVLKPLERAMADGDKIYAVVLGSAINQDGRTGGITVPRADAQEALIQEALRAAEVAPSQVQYVEAHGTGTRVGDPIEAAAIGHVLSNGRSDSSPCLIGSVKTNIGHMEAGAGIAGMVKTALALEHGVLPPNLHFRHANPDIPLDDLRLRVVTELQPWPKNGAPAIAGVNSFGFGGANAHVVLEEPPESPLDSEPDVARSSYILPISARHPKALRQLLQLYAQKLGQDESASLDDLSYSAGVRRGHHSHRVAVVGTTPTELVEQINGLLSGSGRSAASSLKRAVSAPKLAFVFTGMGPQWWAMGRQLMTEEPVFREVIEECDQRFRSIGSWSLLEALTADESTSRVHQADLAPVANSAIQMALVALWKSWGVVPDAIVGHSAGEFAAACAAGALTLQDLLLVGFHRGRLQARASGTGTMLGAGISEGDASARIDECGLTGRVTVAAINSPVSVTLSGERSDLDKIAEGLAREDRFHRFLPVDVPYHSPVMDAMRGELLQSLSSLTPRSPEIPLASSVSGTWVEEPMHDAAYWFANLRRPVRFAQAIDRLSEDGFDLFVEIGPHPVLSMSVSECLSAQGDKAVVLPSLRRKEGERLSMLRSLAVLYGRGRRVEWANVCPKARLVSLPPYPWQKERHWLDPDDEAGLPPMGVDSGHPLLGYRLRSARSCWEVDLAQPALDYLDDHVVHDNPVFPGAGYIEMALAAAGELLPEGVPVVEDLKFRKALFLPARKNKRLQLLHDAPRSSFEIYSSTGAGEWELNASGRLSSRPPERTSGRQDLEAIRRRCGERLAVEEVYDALAARGLHYRGAFQGIEAIYAGERESLARIALASAPPEAGASYRVHPALLDSAFQSLLAASTSAREPSGLYLPVSLEQLKLAREPGTGLWAHARLEQCDEKTLRGDVDLFTDDGELAVAVRGFCCAAVEESTRAKRSALDELLYELAWEPKALGSLPSAGRGTIRAATELVAEVRPWALQEADARGWLEQFRETQPILNEVVAHYARAALLTLGWDGRLPDASEVGSLAKRLQIRDEQGRFFRRLLEIVAETRLAKTAVATAATELVLAEGLCGRVLATLDGSETLVALLRRCGAELDGILSGRADAREVLFAPDMAPIWARLFAELPGYEFYNDVVGEVIVRATEQVPVSTPLRVLEIGAGTAGTTLTVLRRLQSRAVDYYFTDVSGLFLAQARRRFRDQSAVHVASLDIEEDPIPQIGAEPFDVVLAANVLHATEDLRRTLRNVQRALAPGGLLVLIEVTRKMAWSDLIFGVTEGWWRFTDVDLREDHSLLSPARWQTLLTEEGFEGATWVSEEPAQGEPSAAVMLATQPAQGSGKSTDRAAQGRRWLLLPDSHGLAESIASALRSRNDGCVVASGDGDDLLIDGEPLPAWLAQRAGIIQGIIHTRSLDAPATESLTAESAVAAQVPICGTLVQVLQAFNQLGRVLPPLWVVTAGAQPVGGCGAGLSLAQAPVWGLGRVLTSEHASAVCRFVDLSRDCTDEEVAALVHELDAGDDEEELAFRGVERYVSRLRRTRLSGTDPSRKRGVAAARGHLRLDIDAPGTLESVTLREIPERKLAAGEVSIRVRASGINFRDVMLALGMLPPMEVPGSAGRTVLGFECSGIVEACGEGVTRVRPDDEVMAIAVGAFASSVVTRAEMVVAKPTHLSFEEAATIPLAFVTAHYGLSHLASMVRGERVLIHAATGGVGLAAIQLAQRAGAEIFATAGNPEKRAYLRHLGIGQVMDSRSLSFADQVLEATGGEGVDIILNSLAGAAISKGLSILAPYGRFIELGKRDIQADSPIGLLPFDRNLAFCSIALDRLCLDRPHQVGSMLEEVTDLVDSGALEPLRHRAFDLSEAESALRCLAQARHMGKLVLTVGEREYMAAPCAERALFRPDATYLITGGVGGFGLAVGRWMVESGARHLVLMSRSGEPVAENREALRALLESPAQVVIAKGDVNEEVDVRRVINRINATMPALRGVVHGAMVIDDVLLQRMGLHQLRPVLEPKIGGAWNLHTSTAREHLDFFVMLSSMAGVLGTTGQGSYAAGNQFLDALASYRRSLGLPALTIGWGALSEVGYVSRHQDVERHLDRYGMGTLTPAEALDVLEQTLRLGFTQVMAARLDWARFSSPDPSRAVVRKAGRFRGFLVSPDAETGDLAREGDLLPQLLEAPPEQREALLESRVSERVAEVLGMSSQSVDSDLALTDLGVDSLMAVELQAIIERDVGATVSLSTLLEAGTVSAIVRALLDQLDLGQPGSGTSEGGTDRAAATESAHEKWESATEPSPPPVVVDPNPPPAETVVEASGTNGDDPSGEKTTAELVPVEQASPLAIGTASSETSSSQGTAATTDYSAIDYGRWPPMLKLSQWILRVAFRLSARIEVQGSENIPSSGPVLLALNHLCTLDAPLVLTVLKRRGVCVATDDLKHNPWFRWALDLADAIYLRRGAADQAALDQCLAVLRAGGLLGIAPEGTRSKTGALGRGLSGAVYLAAESGAPIIPMVAWGQERLTDNLKKARRTSIHVHFGSRFEVSAETGGTEGLFRNTERLMTTLAAMLPPEYRGVYAD